MATAVTIDAETDAGKLDDLAQAIQVRTQYLRETTADATVAAGINILSSLKASTRKAPVKEVPEGAYKIVATDLFGGLYRAKGERKSRVCARVGSHYGKRSHIRPAMGFAPGGNNILNARVYAIYTYNPNDTFKPNKNYPAKCWYVLCLHEGQAKAFAEDHVRKMLRKESGMAKYALGIAQAQLSTRSEVVSREQAIKDGAMSPKAAVIAYDASNLTVNVDGFASGAVSVEFTDELKYSSHAAGGDAALADAIGKATRKMVGYVERSASVYFDGFHKDGSAPSNRKVVPW